MTTERYVLGLDDTGAPETQGTSKLAREFADLVEQDGFAATLGVTRHRLWDGPKVPATSIPTLSTTTLERHSGKSCFWGRHRRFSLLDTFGLSPSTPKRRRTSFS